MSDRPQSSSIPAGPRLRLAHASLQAIADDMRIRLLHVKGPALDQSLLQKDMTGKRIERGSTDADVLVDPRHARRFVKEVQKYGWQQYTTFMSGSPFGHAATMWHDQLGYADIHRYFPGVGISPRKAFDLGWKTRTAVELAHRVCWAPSVDVQRLILLLHAARSGGTKSGDLTPAWHEADDNTRARTRRLASNAKADLPLAAAIGELDLWKGDRRYDLWHQFSSNQPHSRTAEWVARLKAASGPIAGAKIAIRSLFVNTDHLAMQLGRAPTRKEVWQAWFSRFRRAVDETRERGN